MGHHSAAVLGNHGQGALGEVAEIVGEIGVDACDDRLVRVVAILPERNLAEKKVADRIDTVDRGELRRIDHVAGRFRHLLPAIEQEAVHDDLPGQRQVRRH